MSKVRVIHGALRDKFLLLEDTDQAIASLLPRSSFFQLSIATTGKSHHSNNASDIPSQVSDARSYNILLAASRI